MTELSREEFIHKTRQDNTLAEWHEVQAHDEALREQLEGEQANSMVLRTMLEETEENLEAAEAREATLRTALAWFLDDERFDIFVGGNPNVVPKMMQEARQILKERS